METLKPEITFAKFQKLLLSAKKRYDTNYNYRFGKSLDFYTAEILRSYMFFGNIIEQEGQFVLTVKGKVKATIICSEAKSNHF